MPFTPGRVDATDARSDVPTFECLAPVVDGFRGYVQDGYDRITSIAPE